MHHKWHFFTYALVLLLFCIALVAHVRSLSGVVYRNLAMLQILYKDTEESYTINESEIINLLKQDIALNPSRLITHARLTNILLKKGDYEAAEKQIETYHLNDADTNFCDRNQPSLLHFLITPSTTATEALLFSQPISQWVFNHSGDAVSRISYVDDQQLKECVSSITVNFTFFPQRYIVLYRSIYVKPERLYQINVYYRAQGLKIAWLGIGSAWTGVPIGNTDDWNLGTFQFRTQPLQNSEVVQFVVEDGQGILEIRNVTLDLIEHENHN